MEYHAGHRSGPVSDPQVTPSMGTGGHAGGVASGAQDAPAIFRSTALHRAQAANPAPGFQRDGHNAGYVRVWPIIRAFSDCSTSFLTMLGYRRSIVRLTKLSPNVHALNQLLRAAERLRRASSGTNYDRLQLRRKDGAVFTVGVTLHHTPGQAFVDCTVENIQDTETHEQQTLELLNDITELRGADFLGGTVRILNRLFPNSFVALCTPTGQPGELQSVAALHRGEPVEDYAYTVFGTPSEAVFEGEFRSFNQGVCELFPNDAYLKALNAQSYMGIPLVDEAGNAAGLIHVISASRLEDDRPLRRSLEILAVRAGLELARRHSEEKLQTAWQRTVTAISRTIEQRDPYTGGHQERTAQFVECVARELGWSEERVEGLRMGALIHDIGKIAIPAEVLVKPSKLSTAEFDLIKSHPTIGYDIVKDIDFPWPVREMIHQHHERLDGSGYPLGLKGDEIIPEARLLAIADVAESMSSHRPYRAALGMQKASEEIRRGMGTLYDAEMAATFLYLLEAGKLPGSH